MAGRPADELRLPRHERRRQILSVATTAFAEAGFRGTSLADVAARVGVSQPGLLHHYPSKEALILAVLEDRDRADAQALEELFGDTEPGLADWWTAVCRRNVGQPELVRLFTVTAAEALDPGHPAHEYYRARFRRSLESVTRRVRIDQAAARLDPALDPATTAAELLALTNGVQLQWLMDPGTDMCAILLTHLARLAPRREA